MDVTAEGSPPPSALRLLSLDGGGIRGISALVILDEIMHRVQRAKRLSSVPLPADYFDLICGTSTGGLIALLLGRLRLSVPEAIDKYRILAEQVFSERKAPGRDGIFKASNLEKAIKGIIQEKLGPGHADERMFTNEGCKTFVCAVPARHINKEPRLFRTWEADKYPGYNCKIWEAGRATSAAPTFFKRIHIGDPGLEEEFVDGAMGCNNPVKYLVEEAQREFGPVREVSSIVSIGTGKPRVAGFGAPGLFQRALPFDLITALANMATDSEAEASVMKARYQNCQGLYHRLNVERGLEEVALEEWKKLGDVKTHTMAYLRQSDINADLDEIVDSLVQKTSRTFRLSQLDGVVPASDHTAYLYMYPSSSVNYFVRRTHAQQEIRKYFQSPRTTPMPTVFVLLGMGGCGKSQLALEYCQQSENVKSYRAIFWIDAMSPTTIEQGFTTLAGELSKPMFEAADIEGNVLYVLSTLSTWREPWLLVFDNFDDLHSFQNKNVKEYFPRSNKGAILVTSRDGAARDLGYHIDVSAMSEAEALELLFRRSETAGSEANLQDARRVIKRLGFHALGIDQAGAYIRARNLDFDLFLEHYNKRQEEVINETPGLWEYKRKLKTIQEMETKLTVFTTWELSFNLLTGDENARSNKEHILTLSAFFDGNEISDALFESNSWMTSPTRDDVLNQYKFQDILQELNNLSLVQGLRSQKSGTSFSLHPLVQDWMKLRIPSELRRAYTVEATLALSNFIATHAIQYMTLDIRQTTSSHLEAVLQNEQEYLSQEDRVQNTFMLDATSQLACFLTYLGRYKMAEDLCRGQFHGRSNLLGKEHPDTLTTMRNLALILQRQGKLDEAECMNRQTLALRKKVWGKEHPDTLTAMRSLASVLLSQGKLDDVECMLRQTLALMEKVLGKEHLDTVTAMGMLASALLSQGKLDEAEAINRRTLVLIEKDLGKEHPDTLTTMTILASILQRQGKLDEAERMNRQTLALREKVWGKEHLDTLTAMSSLASVLLRQGKLDEAERINRQTLALEEKVLGKEHPDTLVTIGILALVLQRQGKLDNAECMLRQTLALMEKVLGKEDPCTLASINNLALVLREQGKLDEAERMHRRTLALRGRVSVKEHFSTLPTMNNRALLGQTQCKLDKAKSIFRWTLRLGERVVGKEHPSTLAAMHYLALVLRKQGKLDEAEPITRRTLALREKILGKEHPDTLESMHNLAFLLQSQGKLDESKQLLMTGTYQPL